MNTYTINVLGGIIEICYLTSFEGLESLDVLEHNVIVVNYKNTWENRFQTEEKSFEILDANKQELLSHVKQIINENIEFYNNFDFDYSYFTTVTHDKPIGKNGLPVMMLRYIQLYFSMKMKKIEVV